MSLYVLNTVFSIFGVRGPDRQNGDFPVGPQKSPPTANASWLIRMLGAAVVAIAFLALALWAAVWLALKFL